MFVTIPSTDFEEKIRMEGAVQTIRDVLMPEICQFKRAKSDAVEGRNVAEAEKTMSILGRSLRNHQFAARYYLLVLLGTAHNYNVRAIAESFHGFSNRFIGAFLLFPHIMDVVKAVETYITKLVSVPSAMKVLLLDTHTVCSEPFLTY